MPDNMNFLLQDKSTTELLKLIDIARIPTAPRVLALEAEIGTLRRQLAEAKKKKSAQASSVDSEEEEDDADAKAKAAARQMEQAELVTAPNPINQYVEMLEEEVCCACMPWCTSICC